MGTYPEDKAMFTRRKLFTVGGLMIGAVGCSLDTFQLNLSGTAGKRETVLNGSLEATSRATSRMLTEMGLFYTTTSETDSVLLEGATKQGHRYRLHLRRNRIEGAETTAIEIRWEREPDDAFWLGLLQAASQVQTGRNGG